MVVRGPVHKVVRSRVHRPGISVVDTIKLQKIIGIAFFVDRISQETKSTFFFVVLYTL